MPTPSSFNKYLIGPDDPSQITLGFFNDTGLAPNFISYHKVGNLYYGFDTIDYNNSATDRKLAGDMTSQTEIATILGITINNAYIRPTSGGPSVLAWNGATWTSSGSATVLDAILAN